MVNVCQCLETRQACGTVLLWSSVVVLSPRCATVGFLASARRMPHSLLFQDKEPKSSIRWFVSPPSQTCRSPKRSERGSNMIGGTNEWLRRGGCCCKKKKKVSLPAEANPPTHAELPDGDDEAQECQEPRQAPGGRRGQRLLHLLSARKVTHTCIPCSNVW